MNQFCSQCQLATECKRLFGINPFAVADAARFFHDSLALSLWQCERAQLWSTNNSDPRQTAPVSYI